MARRVEISGAMALRQEQLLNRPIKKVDYDAGNCYLREILKSYYTSEVDEDGKPRLIYREGIPSQYMFQQILGVNIKDRHLGNDTGLELPLKYADEVAVDLLTQAAAFDLEAQPADTTVDYKKAYANLIRYIVNFVENFTATKEADKYINGLNTTLDFSTSEEQQADPNFDEDAHYIRVFKELKEKVIPKDKDATNVFKGMCKAAKKAIGIWAIANSDIRLATTYTIRGNFGPGKFAHGSIEPAQNDGGAELNKCKTLVSLARDLEQCEFIASGASAGVQVGTKVFTKNFGDWLGAQGQNNEFLSNPNPNGVAFVISTQCTPSGDEYVLQSGSTEPVYEVGVMNWTEGRTKKVYAEKNTGDIYTDPDVIFANFKFNGSTDKKEAGQALAITQCALERVPYQKVYELFEESVQPTTPDRVRGYQPVDLELIIRYFAELVESPKYRDYLTPELRTKHARALEILESSKTSDSIEAAMNNTSVNLSGVQMDVNLGIITDDEAEESMVQPQAEETTSTEEKKPSPTASKKPTVTEA